MNLPARDTIFALSSGLPPAGIAVVRVSGPLAGPVLEQLAGKRPAPRRASYRALRDGSGVLLDHALVLWLPGPATATGEDLAELHLHGGRAVVAALLSTLGRIEGLRAANPGEFTRRAFENGRIDLAEAEGLADLLAAETESQHQSALAMAEGALGQLVEGWQARLLALSAKVEADLDFSDEEDAGDTSAVREGLSGLSASLSALLAEPGAERLRDGVPIVLTGPPNSGKSSLFNMLVEREAAITSDIPGTTRDRIEAPVAFDGVPLLFIDTAGLHAGTGDAIEAIGMERTADAVARADIVLWLGPAEEAPQGALLVAAKADIEPGKAGLAVSVRTGEGIGALKRLLIERARAILPRPGALALNQRHRAILADVLAAIDEGATTDDPLVLAEHLRNARNRLDRLTGRSGVEDMLDALFGSMCIGK